ncbi:prepilin-type N-terminal cleavage/methylation domain-containing protein [Deinococcus apachensis]|uniref:prepilin-type N-terminal cleavage/methylation domain-containing protein n=1 Tax=Deinococcus apachensis TaxID=309886 RepID=UPI0003644DBF|nr:prepilin-type N-terminal cleavage/methylation domain-containing protein [Deinococcus apachensis]
MRRQDGLTITEVLVAIVIVLVIVASVMPLLTASMLSNSKSRTRSQALTAAETWLDRYRSGREPLDTVAGVCTKSATKVVTCTYDYKRDYTKDTAIASHVADGATLNTQFVPFKSTIVATPISSGMNATVWALSVTVAWQQKEEQRVNVYTRFTQ